MTLNKKIMKAAQKVAAIDVAEAEKRLAADILAQENRHTSLFYDIFGREFPLMSFPGERDPEIHAECRPRLEIAKRVIDRIEELSMGQWKYTYPVKNRTLVKYFYLKVSLTSAFLEKMGLLPSPRNTVIPVEENHSTGNTTLKVHLGCVDCREAMGVYARTVLHGADSYRVTVNKKRLPIMLANGSRIARGGKP